jgi:hypothetical protein
MNKKDIGVDTKKSTCIVIKSNKASQKPKRFHFTAPFKAATATSTFGPTNFCQLYEFFGMFASIRSDLRSE